MKLIDVTCSYSDAPDFLPRTPDQLSLCAPMVDYHPFRCNQHYSERFQSLALSLWPSTEEKRGFSSLEHYESREADSPE